MLCRVVSAVSSAREAASVLNVAMSSDKSISVVNHFTFDTPDAGSRNAELAHLNVCHIYGKRMVIHIQGRKGRRGSRCHEQRKVARGTSCSLAPFAAKIHHICP
jgi:hypothetical protein